MSVAIEFKDVGDEQRELVGGKGFALCVMAREGLPVPAGICITTEAYLHYLADTGLRVKILRELNRKRFEDMRWEEMWDTALRIRNLFLRTPMPESLSVRSKTRSLRGSQMAEQ